MQRDKLVHRMLSPPQAVLMQQVIDNYRRVQKLLREWEVQTERLIDAEVPRET